MKKLGIIGAASDISQLIQAGVVIAIAVGTYLAGVPFLPPPAVPVIGGFSGAAILISIVWAWQVIRRRIAGRRNDWNPGLWMKSREGHAAVKSPTEIRYHNRVVLVARSNNQIELRWRIGWTGGGTVKPYVNNPGFRAELEPAPADFCQILTVRFDQPIHKNTEITVDFGVITVARPDEPQQPFYQLTLFESRLPKEARLEVQFDPQIQVSWVLKELYANDTAPWPLHPPERVALGNDRCVSWPLECVKGRRYGLRWEYE